MLNNLGPAPVRSEAVGEVLSPERALVLEELQSRTEPATCSQLAEHLDLHTNTVRLHLQALVERGLVGTGSSNPKGRGRPAAVYSALPQLTEPDKRVRELIGLASALAGYVERTSPEPAADAQRIGRQWARTFEDDLPENQQPDQPMESAVARLDQLGFAPRLAEIDGGRRTFQLRRCPLLDVAKQNSEVVCNVHLGLVQGTLDRLDRPEIHAGLEPFAEPGACLLHLHP